MAQNSITLQTPGLYVEPNNLSVPEGSLTQASNVIIKRDNVIEPRRGFQLFGTTFGTITDTLKQLFVYQFTLLRHWGSTLQFDTGTVDNAGQELFESFSTSFTEAQPGLRTKSAEMSGNLYLTSSAGIQKLSVQTPDQFSIEPVTETQGGITQAGGIKALDVQATPIIQQGNITGFMTQDSTVQYAVVWGTNDLNNNLILGVPSEYTQVYLPLQTLLVTDFNNTLQGIQNTANQVSPNNSLINESDYVSSLSLPSTATADDIQTNLIALATKLDNNIEIAANPTVAAAPLTISAIQIVNNSALTGSNIATVTFTGGNPLSYWVAGSNISLSGFQFAENGSPAPTIAPTPASGVAPAAGNINGPQVVTSVTSTTITFLTSATGNQQVFTENNVYTSTSTPPTPIPTSSIAINNSGFKNHDAVVFTNVGGTLPAPLVAGTVYYIGNVSNSATSGYFQVYSDQGLTTLVPLTSVGTGTNTATFFMPVTNTSINSYDFSIIAQPAIPDIPTPDQELVALQTYLQAIISQLQKESPNGTPPIISAYSQSTFISELDLTTSANVSVTLTIPQGVDQYDFFQVYRSPVLPATGTDVLSELTPSSELQQVYEAYPTPAQIAAGSVTFTDIVPDAFLGADLYTNPSSGVGIANANEVPPFALDINKFKNVMFYANTRTKYLLPNFNLLGVSKMIVDYNMGDIPSITITDGVTTNTYTFVLGVEQVTRVTTTADTAGSLAGKYFLIWSANNVTEYYVWYNVAGVTSTDPMVAGATGVPVYINENDSAGLVAYKTNNAINTLLVNDFTSTAPSLTFTSTNVDLGTDQINNLTNFTGFVNANPVEFSNAGGALPGPLVSGTVYYLGNIIPSTSTSTGSFKIYNDSGLTSLVTLTSVGSGIDTMFSTLITSTNNLEGYTNSASAGTSGFTVSTLISGVGQDAAAHQILLSNLASPSEATAATAQSMVQVINQDPNGIVYAFYLSNGSTVPGEMTLESRTFTTPMFYVIANNPDTGSSFSPNILLNPVTISSISTGSPGTSVVTTTTPHGLQTGQQVVISDTNSTPNLDGLWTVTYLTPTTFKINTTVLVTIASTQGYMIAAKSAVSGNNNALINSISYSNILQPEAVPLPNTLAIGDADKAILRIFPLRDSLFVFKEDGLWRISGQTAPWTVELFDSSVLLTAPDSLGVTKNIIFGWTTQGILSVTESGVSNPPISRPIDTIVLALTEDNYPNFGTATWGVGYDSDNSYIVYTVQNVNDTIATIAYRYSNLTSSWTTWAKTDTCGIVDIKDDKLYLGAGNINSMEQERKTFSRFDYADWEFSTSLELGTYFGDTIILPNTESFNVGDVLVQNQNVTVYTFNALLQKLNLDSGLQSNQISSISTGSTPTITTVGNHYLQTGDYVDISNTMTTPLINGLYQVTVTSSNSFTINVPSPVLTAGTSGFVKYDYYYTLMMVAGDDIQTSLDALANRLDIEPNLIYKQSTITISSNSVANPTIITTSSPNSLGPVGTERIVRISGSNSTPSINGDYTATVTAATGVTATQLSIPVNVTVAGTSGTLTTLDDYVTGISSKSGTITAIAVNEPSIITSANHGMVSDRYITISGSNSSPVIDGNYTATIIDQNNFSITVDVLIAGTTGTWETDNDSFQDTLVNYNFIIQQLNNEVLTTIRNYSPITNTTWFETIITDINYKTNTVTTDLTLDFLIGPMTVYQAIPTQFTYSPVTFKDPLNSKQVSEATLMFENKAFTTAVLSFASDLVPQFFDTPFSGNGNGSFGLGDADEGQFGNNFFGGAANAAPFRTYIPRNIQRCRYIVPQFTHRVALETYAINGLTLTGNIGLSSRAYR